MENTKHLFEDSIYLISNHSVARNPMFANEELQVYFKDRMEKYLEPICSILAYSMNDNEFQILVKLKGRKDFEDFYLTKKRGKILEDIPETTYIFSQQMANLQVSFVKHFNWRYSRSGALVARRFNRMLVESEEEMKIWIHKLNSGTKLHNYGPLWLNDLMKSTVVMTSEWLYEDIGSSLNKEYNMYLNGIEANLASSFIKSNLKELKASKTQVSPKSRSQMLIFHSKKE